MRKQMVAINNLISNRNVTELMTGDDQGMVMMGASMLKGILEE